MDEWYSETEEMDDGLECCARCESRCRPSKLQRVPWMLQVAAFPLTGLFFIKKLFSISSLGLLISSKKVPAPEYFDRYCPSCLVVQGLCHIVVAVWAIGLVVYWVNKSLM